MYDYYHDPFNDYHHMPPYNGEEPDSDESIKGCLITGLMLVGFFALLVIAYLISKLY